jgi:acetoin utilization deacetylase AcuC-like enzyme
VAALAVVTDALCAQHVAPLNHDEDPARLLAAQRGFERSRCADSALRLSPRDATLEELTRAHTPRFIERVLETRGGSGWFDPDTYYSPASAAVALRASGAAVVLTDAVLDGRCQQGIGLWRPPGHHASAELARGFCIFNHVAVAARHAQRRGAERILILDWDVHHGNGTQEIFESDPGVLYISLHQGRPQYPQTGAPDEVGNGDGRGYTVNLPLAIGADGATYASAFERVVLPIVEQYRPDLTFVSAGYDAHERDPLGGMCLRSEDYAWLTRQLVSSLGGEQHARIAFCLEGGYHRQALTDAVQTTLDALATQDDVADPRTAGRELRVRHAAELAAIEALQGSFWKLG